IISFHVSLYFFCLLILRPPISTLFPYTTLFRSAYTITTPLDEEEDDHFLVFVTGATGEYTSEEDANGDALSFYIAIPKTKFNNRSEEHTSELQSRENLVCRLLLEKKKKTQKHLD